MNAMAPDDPDDPKVKQLIADSSLTTMIDLATQRELEKWFGKPSFIELAERPPAKLTDPEMAEVIVRRDKALAAVDPELVEDIRVRTEERPETLLKFAATIDVVIDENMALFDHGMVDRAAAIAEPRDVEISDELIDALKECTPQALLRDLHRPELDFEKTFEVVDFAAEQRFDIVAEVNQAMATSWKLPILGQSPLVESAAIYAELRAERRRPWTSVLPLLTNRRTVE